jgi:peptide/nickel transport system substrate-binding protein
LTTRMFYIMKIMRAVQRVTTLPIATQTVDKLIDQQSIETDMGNRKQLVWQIERKLVEDDARPVIFFPRNAVCRQPPMKGLTLMVKSIYNGQRFEDLRLAK